MGCPRRSASAPRMGATTRRLPRERKLEPGSQELLLLLPCERAIAVATPLPGWSLRPACGALAKRRLQPCHGGAPDAERRGSSVERRTEESRKQNGLRPPEFLNARGRVSRNSCALYCQWIDVGFSRHPDGRHASTHLESELELQKRC